MRHPKPHWRESRRFWYAQYNSKQHILGRDHKNYKAAEKETTMQNMVAYHNGEYYPVVSWDRDKSVYILHQGRIKDIKVLGEDYDIMIDKAHKRQAAPAPARPQYKPNGFTPVNTQDRLPIRRNNKA